MKYHIKVYLANGIVESYYPEVDDKPVAHDFRTTGGFQFERDDSVDWWPCDMVKGVQISEFKGFEIKIGNDTIHVADMCNETIIGALRIELQRLTNQYDAVKRYLETKCPQ